MTNHELHIGLWDWLAENPDKTKAEWPRWPMHQEVIEYNRCFACFDCDLNCCTLQWGDGRRCVDDRSLYWAYEAAHGKERADLAKQIRDLEWNDER